MDSTSRFSSSVSFIFLCMRQLTEGGLLRVRKKIPGIRLQKGLVLVLGWWVKWLHDDLYTLVRWKRLNMSQTVFLSWWCFTHNLILNWANSLVGKGFIFHGILTMIKHGDDTALDFTDDMMQLNLLFQGQWQNNSSKWEDLKIPLAKKSHSVCQIWLAPLLLVCSVSSLRFCWWFRDGLNVVWESTNNS